MKSYTLRPDTVTHTVATSIDSFRYNCVTAVFRFGRIIVESPPCSSWNPYMQVRREWGHECGGMRVDMRVCTRVCTRVHTRGYSHTARGCARANEIDYCKAFLCLSVSRFFVLFLTHPLFLYPLFASLVAL